MKRQTNLQKRLDWADTLKCLNKRESPRRLGQRRADGSLPTKPTIPILNPKPESEVLADCLLYLRKHGYLVNRLNNTKMVVHGQWQVFGIIGGGDIIGMDAKGRHIEVECKKGVGGLWSVEQQRREQAVTSHEGLYLLVHDVTELQELLHGDESGTLAGQRSAENAAEEDSNSGWLETQ